MVLADGSIVNTMTSSALMAQRLATRSTFASPLLHRFCWPCPGVQDFVETSVPATLTNQAHVDTQFITSDLLLSMDQFSKRVLRPKIAALANSVDYGVAQYMKNYTPNIVGTPGTALTAIDSFLAAGAVLDTEATPAMVIVIWSLTK